MQLMINLLAGIPSVVFGLWGLTKLVPLINEWHAPGASLLAAILVLALMILPTIAITACSALKSLPSSYSYAAECLSLSRFTRTTQILLPAASAGIGGGTQDARGTAWAEDRARS